MTNKTLEIGENSKLRTHTIKKTYQVAIHSSAPDDDPVTLVVQAESVVEACRLAALKIQLEGY